MSLPGLIIYTPGSYSRALVDEVITNKLSPPRKWGVRSQVKPSWIWSISRPHILLVSWFSISPPSDQIVCRRCVRHWDDNGSCSAAHRAERAPLPKAVTGPLKGRISCTGSWLTNRRKRTRIPTPTTGAVCPVVWQGELRGSLYPNLSRQIGRAHV